MTNNYLLCEICGNILENVKEESVICCGAPMKELTANARDAAIEKHVPVISINENIVTIKVGEVDHPMLEEHYIKWIYLKTNKEIKKGSLNPGDTPIATFELRDEEKVIGALAYCNLHGLWMKEVK